MSASTIDYKWSVDLGTKDQSCWVLSEGPDIIGIWDHEPTLDEIDIAVAAAGKVPQ